MAIMEVSGVVEFPGSMGLVMLRGGAVFEVGCVAGAAPGQRIEMVFRGCYAPFGSHDGKHPAVFGPVFDGVIVGEERQEHRIMVYVGDGGAPATRRGIETFLNERQPMREEVA